MPPPTTQTGLDLHALVIDILFFSFLAFGILYTIFKSEVPWLMAGRWLMTAVLLWLIVDKLTAMIGLLLSPALIAVWRRPIASLVARPFEALFAGGNEPPIPKPLYSVALARMKQGRYEESVAEIRKQLEKFPNDFEGQSMLAGIQAEHLLDLRGAEVTVQRLIAQPGHAPASISFALCSMADWHLKYGQDLDAARANLQQVIELLPNTEFSLGAAHRIAHLGTTDMLLAGHDRKIYNVPKGVRNLGLQKVQDDFKPVEADPAQVAEAYVAHLQQHPLDMEARENLAIIYADHYHRLDLAQDQLEQMIQVPNQSTKLVIHWLNLLADIQIRNGASYDMARDTLQRIVDRDPASPSANLARNRIATLRLELKGKEKSQAVKLGSYEQNIGLKGNLPRPRHEH